MPRSINLATTLSHTPRLITFLTTPQSKGLEIFASPSWKSIPRLLFAYARVGWYQGSGFFAIAGMHPSSPPQHLFLAQGLLCSPLDSFHRSLHIPVVTTLARNLDWHRPYHCRFDLFALCQQQCLVLQERRWRHRYCRRHCRRRSR